MPWGVGAACGKWLMFALLFFFFWGIFSLHFEHVICLRSLLRPFSGRKNLAERSRQQGSAGSSCRHAGPSPPGAQVASSVSQKSPAGFAALPATFPLLGCITFFSLLIFHWYSVSSVSFYDGIPIPLCSKESFPLLLLTSPSTPTARDAFNDHAAYLCDSRWPAQK